MKGPYTALITPFSQGKLDEKAFCRLVEWQQVQGTRGIVIGGCTGEGLSLTTAELGRLTKLATEVSTSLEIWVGVGAFTTLEARERAQCAQKNDADGLLVYAPPYIKPSQENLVGYFTALHEATSLPLILYNNPTRAGVSLSLEMIQKLAALPRIKGLKDSTPDLSRPTALKRLVPPSFTFLSGEDATVSGFLAQGGHGWISVTGNLFPKECAALCKAWEEGDLKAFHDLRDFLFPFSQVLFQETNPMPVKQALAMLGWCLPEWREPLGCVSSSLIALLEKALELPKMRQCHA